MTDITPLKQAEKLGYIIYWREHKAHYLLPADIARKEPWKTWTSPPYVTIEDAAYAALADYDTQQAQKA